MLAINSGLRKLISQRERGHNLTLLVGKTVSWKKRDKTFISFAVLEINLAGIKKYHPKALSGVFSLRFPIFPLSVLPQKVSLGLATKEHESLLSNKRQTFNRLDFNLF